MQPFKMVLVGTGNIAGTYATAVGKLGCAEIVSVVSRSGHEEVIRDFVEAVRADRDPLVPPAQGRLATDVILAIYRSSEEEKKVRLE